MKIKYIYISLMLATSAYAGETSDLVKQIRASYARYSITLHTIKTKNDAELHLKKIQQELIYAEKSINKLASMKNVPNDEKLKAAHIILSNQAALDKLLKQLDIKDRDTKGVMLILGQVSEDGPAIYEGLVEWLKNNVPKNELDAISEKYK